LRRGRRRLRRGLRAGRTRCLGLHLRRGRLCRCGRRYRRRRLRLCRTGLGTRPRDDGLCHRLGDLRLTGHRRGLRLCWGWGGCPAGVGLRRTTRLGVRVPQPAGHWGLHRGGRGLHELAELLQLRENVLAGYSELLRKLVYSGLACHCSPRLSEAGGM
jgi:hypothetical protein